VHAGCPLRDAIGGATLRRMSLNSSLRLLAKQKSTELAWARRKFDGYYHRYSTSSDVGQRFGEMCLEVLDRLEGGPAGAISHADDAEEVVNLMEGIVTGRIGPAEVRSLFATRGAPDEFTFGMEIVPFLHRLTGGHREHYYEAIAQLPELNDYRPSYITMGPTGKCNVVCPDCIIGGAIFVKERQQLHKREDILPHLDQAEAQGVDRVSFCIGEPTYNTTLLFAAFDKIRESPTLSARSMVTNGLFARKYEKALQFFRDVREHLGPDKARKLMVGVSLNDDLREVGVPVEATANVLQAYGEVFPEHRMVLQLILDSGFHKIQNELFAELGRRGLLADAERYHLESEGTHPELRLTNGLRVVVSQMRKQPSLHNAWSRPGDDPWVRFYTSEALTSVALKGLYTYEDDEEQEPGEGGIVVHRITLGPDGLLFPDYHFMVAATRPLGATMESAVRSFRQDPILTLLLKRGGINLLLATYMSIPADERLIADIYEPALHCSTTGMIAANVIFGDYEVALQLADRLMRHGISAPQSEAPEIQPEA